MNSHSRFVFCLLWFLSFATCNATELALQKPYFSYSSVDIEKLRKLQVPNIPMESINFSAWDVEVERTIENDARHDDSASRLMPYLYVAERDFALLSFQISQQWVGDPSQLIIKVIKLLYPNFQSTFTIESDSYSEQVTDLVYRNIEERFRKEQSQLRDYPELAGPGHWQEKPPLYGSQIGSWQPWLIDSVKEFRAPAPPGPNSIIWVYGIDQIKAAQARLSPRQVQQIKYWAGEAGPESGNWFALFNQFLSQQQLSLTDYLNDRAIFAMGYVDARIACFDSKYTYWVKRPSMLDPQLHLIVALPKHPSYPAAHSTTSAAASVILSHLFPKEKNKWQNLAILSSNTRVWAGLHFIYDNEQGLILGEKVGNAVIEKIVPNP